MQSVTVPSCDRRILALCLLMGHDIHSYPSSPNDPGADLCMTEGCSSAAMVGLFEAARLGREAWATLVCGCPSPADCACPLERCRFKFSHAAAWTQDRLRFLAGVWWRQAEQILNGDTDPAYCSHHTLSPVPCGLCGEEEG